MRLKHPGFTLPLLLVALVLGCGGSEDGALSDPRPVVVSSIFPIGDLVQRLTGDLIRIEVLLPPGASPATFDVTPRQFMDLRDASLFLMIGGGLDEWVSHFPEATGGEAPVVRLSDGVPLLAGDGDEEGEAEYGHDHASGNPHIWLDPILVRDRILPTLSEALEEAFPENIGPIRVQATLLADSLTALDQEIREKLRPLTNRAFIATHSAWTYFANRYQLEEVGVIHAHPGQEPSSRALAALLEVARARKVACLFTEPQLGEVAARALATELSLPTCMLDPLGGAELEGRAGYFQLLRFNAQQLADGLGGAGP